MYDILPRELIQLIYEFDNTYHNVYDKIIKEGFYNKYAIMLVEKKIDPIARIISKNENLKIQFVKRCIQRICFAWTNRPLSDFLFIHNFNIEVIKQPRNRRLYCLSITNNENDFKIEHLLYFDNKKQVEKKTVDYLEVVHYYSHNGENCYIHHAGIY